MKVRERRYTGQRNEAGRPEGGSRQARRTNRQVRGRGHISQKAEADSQREEAGRSDRDGIDFAFYSG